MKMNIGGPDIDLRKEMDELLSSKSYPVILIMVDSKMSCPCTYENGQQASSQCPLCFTTGSKIKAMVIRVIGRPASQYITLPNSTVTTPVGDIYSNAKMYYMDYRIKPTPGSFILEVSWNKGIPTTLLAAYKIAYSEPARLEEGRTEYTICGSHRDITNMGVRQDILKDLKLLRRGKI